MPSIPAILALLSKRSTWITLLVTIGVVLAGFALMNYVATKSENMSLKVELKAEQATVAAYKKNAAANAKAITTRNELIEALAKQEVVERAETVKALEANPAWATQPIPSDILSRLRD